MKKVNKKWIWMILVIAVIAVITICWLKCGKSDYKIGKIGNTIGNKSMQDIEKDILAISKYKATIQVTVESNKNETKYVLEQEYSAPNQVRQLVKEPSNISGLETIYDGSTLTITNSKLNATTIYEQYPYVAQNELFLTSFIDNYNQTEEKKLYEEADQVVLEAKVKSDTNKYNSYQKLYVSKQTGLPTKLIIQDMNHVCKVYILYNEINME